MQRDEVTLRGFLAGKWRSQERNPATAVLSQKYMSPVGSELTENDRHSILTEQLILYHYFLFLFHVSPIL